MMGLSDTAYYCSYFIIYAILSFIVVAFLALMMIKWTVFPESNFFLLFLTLFMFGLSIFPYTIIIWYYIHLYIYSALFNKSRIARIFGAFIFYFLFIAVFPFVNKERGTLSAKLGTSLFPQVALSLALGVYTGAEVHNII